MATNQYDANIIGGGHNGLIAVAYLARAKKKGGMLERCALAQCVLSSIQAQLDKLLFQAQAIRLTACPK